MIGCRPFLYEIFRFFAATRDLFLLWRIGLSFRCDLQGWEYTVEVCFIEIYNEVIRDLLRSDKDGNNLKIMQVDGKTNDVVIPGLTVMKVNSFEDLDRLYILAHQNRAVAATSCNERSSRSHSVTKIKVTGVHKERNETCYGAFQKLSLFLKINIFCCF